jgi:hypothetical protein
MFLRLTFAAGIAFFISEALIFAQEHPEHPEHPQKGDSTAKRVSTANI